jgi:SAM-dependent methyltransferase
VSAIVCSNGYITDVAYVPASTPHLAPVAIRYAASVNRAIPPPTAAGFRYLELGCGLGGSLIMLAAANPQGEFVGVDVNPERVAAAEREAASGGLTNVRLMTTTMPYDIVPVVQTAAGPTVSDAHLRAIWERLVAERKAEMVFYAGGRQGGAISHYERRETWGPQT